MKIYLLVVLFFTCCASFALETKDVLVVANTNFVGSLQVAEKYLQKYNLAENQLLKLALSSDSVVSQKYYKSAIEIPIIKRVEKLGSKVVVLCYGMPWRVVDAGPAPIADGKKSTWTSVDSALAKPYSSHTKGYISCKNPYFKSQRPFKRRDMLLVGRIDGPTLAIALNLIDRQKKTENDMALMDLQSSVNGQAGKGIDFYNISLKKAAETLAQAKVKTILDDNQSLAPKIENPLKYYWGWYAGPNGNYSTNTYKKYKWQPGSVAVHTCSYGARDIRNTKTALGGLLADGVSATIGTVNEPYIIGWPLPEIFFVNYIKNKLTFIESAYAATPFLSWQTVFIGDPLLKAE